MPDHRFFATAPKNLETLLAEELRGMGIKTAKDTRGGAGFTAGLADAYRACMWSRVASRILLLLKEFPAPSPEELYAGVKEIDWGGHFAIEKTFAIDADCANSQINHSRFAALKAKDAIVDQFRDRTGSRPSVAPRDPDIRLNLYISRDRAALSLDLSGESLHRRGWREESVVAPLKENLAAAILLRAGWPEIAASGGALIDPMCGSGTFAIEAAMIAGDIAPGILRQRWGFTAWRGHDPAAWERIKAEARRRKETGSAQIPPIRGYDHDPRAVKAAITNVGNAGLTGPVHIERREIKQSGPAHPDDHGLVVINPPYGERLENEAAITRLYQRIGTCLKDNFPAWRTALFTGRADLGYALGLRAVKVHSLFNGAIACKLLHFDIRPEFFLTTGNRPTPMAGEGRSPGSTMFANRLKKNLKKLKSWRERENITCFRAYDADLPEYNLAIDVYQSVGKRSDSDAWTRRHEKEKRWINVQEYQAPKTVAEKQARLRLREALGEIIAIFSINEKDLFLKTRQRQRGKNQYEKLANEGVFQRIEESGCRFLVNLSDHLDTGIFLDHRSTRRKIAAMARGRDFLNLFAYTGTATVMAAKGGAETTTSVDMSNTYLNWAKRNMAENGFTGPGHRYFREDCQKWLAKAGKEKNRYGLIFLDPPSFSTSKKMPRGKTLDIQRDHVPLIRAAADILTPDGILLFSTNLRGFRLAADRLTGLTATDISRKTIPPDFRNNPGIHQCFEIVSVQKSDTGQDTDDRRLPRTMLRPDS